MSKLMNDESTEVNCQRPICWHARTGGEFRVQSPPNCSALERLREKHSLDT